MKPITLQSQRLLLNPITPSIVHQLFKNKNKQEIISFLGCNDSEYQRFKLMHTKGMEIYNQSLYFFILIDKKTQEPIGECGYHTWNTTHHRAELFYKLKQEKFKQKGLMTEALKKVLDFGFFNMKLHRVQAFVAQENIASIKLLKKYKFQKEGVLREDYLYKGSYEDSICYSLLKTEWKI